MWDFEKKCGIPQLNFKLNNKLTPFNNEKRKKKYRNNNDNFNSNWNSNKLYYNVITIKHG